MKKIIYFAGTIFIICFIISALVIFISANNNKLSLDRQTHVKWDEASHELKVYLSLSNTSKEDITFDALLRIRKQNLVNFIGNNLIKLEKDYMDRTSPFIMSPYKDQVFELSFYGDNQLSKEDLENGFELIIITDKKILTLPINHIYIE